MEKIDICVESFKLKYDLFMIGCDAIEEEGLWDTEVLGEMDGFYFNDLSSVIIRLIASDGNISEKEVEYLNKTFGFEYTLDELKEVYKNCKDNIDHSFDEAFENGISYMRKINSKLADAYKELLALICDIIIESDGIIADIEVDEVKRLKALCE